MSINLPPELGWVARLAVGQSWPKGDEDKMHSLGLAWEDAAQALAAISREITPATRGVLNSVGGSVADEFASFVHQLQSNVPDMAEASGQLGKLGRNTGVQLEYAKYMILAQLVWLAFEIAQMAFWAPEAIPALITSARLIVRMLLRRLLTSIATGIGMMVGMDAVIQGIQMLKGDRTSWSVENTISAIESGAIGGAIGGLTFGLGDAFVPKFAGSLIGKAFLGGASGVASTAAMNALFNSGEPEDLGFGGAAGALGAIAGGRGKRRGGGGDETKVDDFDFHLPDVPDLPDLHGPDKLPDGGSGSGGLGGLGNFGGKGATGTGTRTGAGAGGPSVAPVRTTGGGDHASGGTSGVRPPVESVTGHVPAVETNSHAAAASAPVSAPPPEVRTTGSTQGAGGRGTETGGSTSTFASHSAPPVTTTYHPGDTDDAQADDPAVHHQSAPQNAELPGFTTAFAAPPVGSHTGQGGPSEVAPRAPRPPTSAGGAADGLGATANGTGNGNGTGIGTGNTGHSAVVAHPGDSGDSHLVLPDTPTQSPGASLTSGGPGEGSGGTPAFPEAPTHTPGAPPVEHATPVDPATSASGGSGQGGQGGQGGQVHTFPDVPTHTPGTGPSTASTEPPPGGSEVAHGDGPTGGDPALTALNDLTVPTHPVGESSGSAHPIHDAPDAPVTPLVSPTAHVGPRLDALDRAGQDAGMSSSDRQGYRQAVDQAARSGNLSETTRQLQAFRQHVETRVLNQRYDAFRQHADGGFGNTRVPQSERSTWNHLVDAVEQARRGGDPDLLDSHLREYTAFVENHAPSEALTGRDTPQPYHPDVENVRRQLATATGPDAERLRTQLADLRQTADLRDRLDQLNSRPGGPDPQEAALQRAVDQADGPDAAAQALAQLHDHRADQALQQRLDRLNSDHAPGTVSDTAGGSGHSGLDDLKQRLDTLRGDTDPHEQELLQQLDQASGPDEAAGALDALHDYRDQQDLAHLQQRLDQLANGPAAPTGTPTEEHHATGGPATDDQSHSGRDDLPTDDQLRERIDALDDGDQTARNLRHQAYDANSPEEAQRALDERAARQAQLDQQRQDEADRLRRELDRAEEQHARDLLSGQQNAADRSARTVTDLRDQLDHALPHDQRVSDLHQEIGQGLGDQQDPGHLGRIGTDPQPATGDESPPTDDTTTTHSQQPRPVVNQPLGTSHSGSDTSANAHETPLRQQPTDQVERPAPVPSPTPAPAHTAPHPGTEQLPLQERPQPSEQQTVPTADDTHTDPSRGPVPDTSGLDQLLHGPGTDGDLTTADHTVTSTSAHISAHISDHTGDQRPSETAVTTAAGTSTSTSTSTSAPAPAVRPPARLNHAPRFVVRSSFDQRRFGVGGQTYTDLTVKVALHPGDADPQSVTDTRSRVQEGVETYFNTPGYRLPNGDLLHVTVEHVAPGEQAHLNVELTPGGGNGHTDQRTWTTGAPPITYAHEIGHQLGLRDEYHDTGDPEHTGVTSGLMGNYHVPSEHGLPQGGLGGRHLSLLGALTGGDTAEPPHPAPHPGTETGAGPHPAVQDDPAWQAARSQVPPVTRDHVHVDPVTDPFARPFTAPVDTPVDTAPGTSTSHQDTATDHVEPVTDEPTEPTEPATDNGTVPDTDTTGRPEEDPPPQLTDGWHHSSLAGKRIVEAPGPEAVRQRIEALLGDHANDPLVVQRLNGRLDPANFRKQYPRMVNGGWHFPIHVGGHPYEVRVGAATTPWQLDPTRDAGKDNDGDGLDVKSGGEYTPPKVKTELSSSQSGLDYNPSIAQPVNPNLTVLVSGSVKGGGASHGTETTSTTSTKTAGEVKLTGKTDSYTSQATFDIQLVDHHGRPVTQVGRDGAPQQPAPPIGGQLRADVPRSSPRSATQPHTWQGWNPPPRTTAGDHTAPAPAPNTALNSALNTATAATPAPRTATGHPLTITGLDGVRDAVFDALPKDAQPGGTAHQDIVDFLDPDNVTKQFEQVSGAGLLSKPLTLSGGGTGFLRLTAEPETSTVLHTTDTTTSSGATTSGEQARNHAQSSGWALGAGGGASGEVWHDPATDETKWLTGTGSYTYGQSTAHGAKGTHAVEEGSTVERKGPADVVSTPTRYRVWLTRQHLSPGTDGLHGTTTQEITDHTPPPAPAPGTHVVQVERPLRAPTGDVVRVVPRPPEPTEHTPATATATPPPVVRQAPSGQQLSGPGLVRRTAYSDFPGSEQLERHIVQTMWQTAPGVLPPPEVVHPPQGETAGVHRPVRVPPKAFTNLADLRRQLAPSQLGGSGHLLLDGTFRVSLDSSHLPLLASKTYDVLVKANLGPGTHEGAHTATAKNTLTRTTGTERSVTQGSSHTVAGSGNLRSSLDHTDYQRGFLNVNADGGYTPTHGTTVGDTTEVKRTLTVSGDRDRFSYPVSFDVLTVRQDADHPVERMPTLPIEPHHQSVQHVGSGGGHVTVDVERTETPTDAPPRQVTVDRLPDHHLVEHVGDQDAYRDHARQAVESAFTTRHDHGNSPLPVHVPALDDLVDPLATQTQLRANVSASHGGWTNTADQHVGSGRNRDTAGLSQRTRLHHLTYRETLSGDGKLDVESKTETSVKVQDKAAATGKGGLGGDFGRFPGTPQDPHASTYQLRGGVRGKGSYGGSSTDAVKHTFTTNRKTSQGGPWHVYEGDARITLQGKVTSSTGDITYGEPVTHDHRVRVLLSDEDVRALTQAPNPDPATTTAADPATATATDTATATGTYTAQQPPRRSVPLENGVSGGSRIEIPSTDEILREIDRQIRSGSLPPGDLEAGNGLGEVPLAALPFADLVTPDHLGAHYDELVGPGLLVHKVENYHGVRTMTQVLIKATPGGWQHDGRQTGGGSTRKVTVSEAVTGDRGRTWSAGGDSNIRVSYRAPTAENHLNNVTYSGTAGAETKGNTAHTSSQTTKVEHKTTVSGDLHQFSTPMRFDVTVTRRNASQRFVNLPAPEPVRPDWRATAWVPESMTTTGPVTGTAGGTTTTHQPGTGQESGDQHAPGEQGGGIEMQPVHGTPEQRQQWRADFDSGHDLVGLDHPEQLVNAAHTALNTPRPWGNGILGRTGSAASQAWSATTGVLGNAAWSMTPDAARRVVDSFVHDPRLGPDHQLHTEQTTPLPQQISTRQALSGQALSTVFPQLKDPDGGYRTVPLGQDGRTGLKVSMEPTGQATEVGRRDDAKDEVTVSTEDDLSTSAGRGVSYSVAPADVVFLTRNPGLSVPLPGLNSLQISRDQSLAADSAVTLAPGTPGRRLTPPTVPHGLTGDKPGQGTTEGTQRLLRQPVRVTLQKYDANGVHGDPVTTTHHVYYWSTAPQQPAAPATTPTTAPPPVPAPDVTTSTSTDTTTGAGEDEVEPVPPPAVTVPTIEITAPDTPLVTAPPPPPQSSSSLQVPPHLPTPAPVHTPEPVHVPAPAPGRSPSAWDMPFDGNEGGGQGQLTGTQRAWVDRSAQEAAARIAAAVAGGGPVPVIRIEGSAVVSVDGVPHFGRSLQLADARARNVAAAYGAALNTALDALRASGQALPPAEDVQITFGPSVPWPPATGAQPPTGSVTVLLGPPATATV